MSLRILLQYYILYILSFDTYLLCNIYFISSSGLKLCSGRLSFSKSIQCKTPFSSGNCIYRSGLSSGRGDAVAKI